jgi:eukaryotic-like serine/threonine-protein kinase
MHNESPTIRDVQQCAPAVAATEIFDGRFRLEREIGGGTMGIVFAARDMFLERRVALKVLRPNGEHVARFRREARLMANLQGPHAVRLYDVGRAARGGREYIVMELLEGEDLARVAERQIVPVEDTISFILQACHGLAEAHDAGIIHRDVKLSNLFLANGSHGPTIKVLDFGLAKREPLFHDETVLTCAGTTMGSPLYTSPEQLVCARAVDARTDVWALGVCLYRLLAGRFPFDPSSNEPLSTQIMASDPPPPSFWRPEISTSLDAVVLRCLARVAADRYSDARALGEALAGVIAHRSEPRAHAASRRGWRIASMVAAVSIAMMGAATYLGPRSRPLRSADVRAPAAGSVTPGRVASSIAESSGATAGASPQPTPTTPPGELRGRVSSRSPARALRATKQPLFDTER